MNIALTGSAGLIGSKLLLDLQNMGHEVLCISSSKSSQEDNIFLYEEVKSKEFNFNADFILHLASINSNLSELEIHQEVELIKKVLIIFLLERILIQVNYHIMELVGVGLWLIFYYLLIKKRVVYSCLS